MIRKREYSPHYRGQLDVDSGEMNWTRTFVAMVTLVTSGGVTARQGQRAKSTSAGQRLFQQCIGCHSPETGERKVGPSLKGLFKKRELLNGTPANEGNIRLRIRNGGNGMPSYEQTLSAKELDQVIEYLKSL
jgi:cytochrome c